MKISTINPSTGKLIKQYPVLSIKSLNSKIESTYNTFLEWKTSSFANRKSLMLALAQNIANRKEELAHMMALEMGKPINSGQAELDKCAWVCEHYANHAEQYLQDRIIDTEMKVSKVCHRPLGTVLGIMPWNFPFWQVFRFAAPTIMAGNAVLLKHASISSGCAQEIEKLFNDSGFPQYLFQHLLIESKHVETVIKNPLVAAITLTGGEDTGSVVASQSGKYLKKCMLELGGSDPYVVLEDADLDLAAKCIVDSRLNNSGQVCIAAKRIIAVDSIEEMLIEKITRYMLNFNLGDPLSPSTKLGPLAREDLRITVHKQVEKTLKQGAKLLLGGIIPNGEGFFYPPTLISKVKPGMPAFDEEIFGPVIALVSVKDEKQAIRYANQSQYGLGAAVFTRDLKKGERIAVEEINSGVCFVNAVVSSDPRLPFGGIKKSGFGRELSKEGILEFVNSKTIAINDTNNN